jgi:hypothetical protein
MKQSLGYWSCIGSMSFNGEMDNELNYIFFRQQATETQG